MLNNIFKKIGLGEREVNVYMTCFENEKVSISHIQKNTNLSRSTIYYILETLIKNNIVSEAIENNRKYYIAENPKNIKNILSRKKKDISKTINNFEHYLPTLLERKKNKSVFHASTHNGVQAISKLYANLYENHKNSTVLLFSSIQDGDNKILSKIFKTNIKNRIKFKIKVRGISPFESRKYLLRNNDKQSLRESRFLPSDRYPYKSDIVIFEDVVSFLSFENNEPKAVTIKDQNMVDTMKMIFDLSWDAAEKYDKKVVAEYEKANSKSQISNSKQK